MDVVTEAVSLVNAGRGIKAERGDEKRGTEVAGVETLQVYDDYNHPVLARRKNRKDYQPEPLNAVVVLRSEQMPQGGEPWVLITNGSVKQPLEAFNRYDDRSLIENLGFREGKQGWHLERPPQRNEKAYTAHVFLALATYACSTAYRARCEREAAEEVEEETGRCQSRAAKTDPDENRRPREAIRHYRRRIAHQNRDKVWVRVGEVYGIFHLAELSLLTGIRLKTIPPEVGTRAWARAVPLTPLAPAGPGGPVALPICFATSFCTSFFSDGPPIAGAAIASAAIRASAIVTWLHLTLPFI
jgi:hypothetical protein